MAMLKRGQRGRKVILYVVTVCIILSFLFSIVAVGYYW